MQEAPLFSSSLKMELQESRLFKILGLLTSADRRKREEGNVRKLRGEKMEGTGILYGVELQRVCGEMGTER